MDGAGGRNLTDVDSQWSRQGYRRDSVPPDGALVFLRATANVSTGGTAVDVTDKVHPENRSMLERAARAVDLDIAGIDFITPAAFDAYKQAAYDKGFLMVSASPLTRSSYHADADFQQMRAARERALAEERS